MSTPLTEREKIWAVALGLGKIMRNPTRKEESDQIWHGLEILGSMMTDELEKELQDLALRNSHELKNLLHEVMGHEKGVWPEIETEPKRESKMEQKAQDFHGMTHHESILVTAIGLAALMRKRVNPDLIKPGLKLLADSITDADLKFSKDLAVKGYKKCGCKQCQSSIDLVDLAGKINETLDKDKPDDDGYDPEDPYRTLSA